MNLARDHGARARALLLALTAFGFAMLFAVSWQEWADLAIDGGREMNTPLRLLRGELIYSDVYYLYGPLAPYLNAALYAVFGVHLNTLYAAGTIASLLALLLVFHLGARLTGFGAAVLTTWTVLVFCVFKRNGNYIFPYTYSAVYGTLLGLAALASQIRYIQESRQRWLTLSGVFAGLALICKLEFGFAATASLVVVAFSEQPGARFRTLIGGLCPALMIPLVVYGILLAMMPWDALVKDTFLWPAYIPPELIYFNRTKLGLGDPAKTLRELLSAVAMLGIAASAVLAASARLGAGSVQTVLETLPRPWRRTLLVLAGGSVSVLLVNAWVYNTRWDVSPFRALPVLCAGLVCYCAWRRDDHHDGDRQRRSLLVVGVYGVAVLARVMLRVPSGGGYGSYLLPVPLLVFTHLGTRFYRPVFAGFPASASLAGRIVLAFFTTALAASAVVVGYRYATNDYVALNTARGTTKVSPAQRRAFDGALGFIAQATRPEDYLAALPEGSSLNFLGDRPAPLRYEIVTPGFLDANGEQRAIQQLKARRVEFIFLLNRPTTEFGCPAFGQDCYRALMEWIEANYDVAAVFGEGASAASTIGDQPFFIKSYRHKTAVAAGR
jgi:4-amino-4-deoxy-L-arabinose transferase-like glycosyltransferase